MKISNIVYGIGVVVISITGVAAVMAIVGAIVMMPDRWSDATVVRICRDGTRIYRLADGTIEVHRDRYHGYRVEDEKTT
jgi:hypothetical protein